METWMLLFGLAIGCILFARTLFWPKKTTTTTGADILPSETLQANSSIDQINSRQCYTSLPKVAALQLALTLIEKTIPVWENYTRDRDISYKNFINGPANKIDSQLVQDTVAMVSALSHKSFPPGDQSEIKMYYNKFLDVVIALHDANWVPPYPIKKIFLSTYAVLKSILENNGAIHEGNQLSVAIEHALDCLDISKIFSKKDIENILLSFHNKSLNLKVSHTE